MKLVYKKILALELWHDYYLGQPNPSVSLPTDYDLTNKLLLIPTPECEKILKNLRWGFRTQANGATIYASAEKVISGESQDKFETLYPIDKPYRLTFYLVVRDRYFTNYTNLSLHQKRDQIYYFSNLSNNQLDYISNGDIKSRLFLTKPLVNYAGNTEYHLGKLILNNGKTFEAINHHVSPEEPPQANYWQKNWTELPLSQYVSDLDLLSRPNLVHRYIIPNANPGEVFRLVLKDSNHRVSFVYETRIPDNHPADNSFSVILDFSQQIPGLYHLFSNEREVDKFVIFNPIKVGNPLALIEIILSQDLVPPGFSLLQYDSEKTLIQPKTYIIRFKNRSTRWRYKYEDFHGFCLNSQSSSENQCKDIENDFIVVDKQTYVTKRPIGLRDRPETLLSDNGNRMLPMPSVKQILPEIRTNKIVNIFSDIYR